MSSNTKRGLPQISQYFYCIAVICGMGGMGIGALMGMQDDYTLMAAHAHLNLLGWVTLALMGGYYRQNGLNRSLAVWNLMLSTCGALVLPLAHALRATGTESDLAFKLGATTALLGMAVFLAGVFIDTFGRERVGTKNSDSASEE
jgi:hypothetical protein